MFFYRRDNAPSGGCARRSPFGALPLNHRGSAVALARGVAEIAAGTRVHGGSQHEAGGKGYGDRSARYRHGTILQRPAHYLQYIALKLRQFIQKEHAVVAERHLAGPRYGAAADEPSIADGVMRGAEGPRAHQAASIFQDSGDAVDARGLDGFFQGHGRQD